MNNVNKYIKISFANNVFLTLIKLFFGYISKSKTLIADGVHCASDMLTDIIGYIGNIISSKKPDVNHPFGHGKAEYITSIFISIFIIILSVKIFINSFTPTYKIDNYYILLISFISIVTKYFISNLLIKKGKILNSNILVTSGTESKYDVLSSTFAFVFILLSFYQDKCSLLRYADTIGSIVISIMTFKVGISLFILNFNSSLGEVDIKKESKNNIKNILCKYKEIKNIRRITILKYGTYRMLIIDIEVKGRMSINKFYELDQKIKYDIKSLYKEYKYININVRPKK